MKKFKYISLICICLFISNVIIAQEEEQEPEIKPAKMSIQFDKVDTVDVCKVLVTSEDKPVPEVSVKLFVKRLFGLLPIDSDQSTDENGIATFEFPTDIPLSLDGKLQVIAKVEDDEKYGTFEASTETQLGVPADVSKLKNTERGLAAARDKAPIYFIIASVCIIAGIWGTLLYVVLQVFKIKRLSSVHK